jgi:hypothetical protein
VRTLLNDVTLVGYIYTGLMHAAVACVFQAHTLGRGWGKDWVRGEGWLDAKRPERLERGGPC